MGHVPQTSPPHFWFHYNQSATFESTQKPSSLEIGEKKETGLVGSYHQQMLGYPISVVQ